MKNITKMFIVLCAIVLFCACNRLPETASGLNSSEIVKTVKTVKPWRWRVKEVKINVAPERWQGDSSGIYILIDDPFKTFKIEDRGVVKYHPRLSLWFCPSNWEGGTRLPGVQAICPVLYLGKNDIYKIFYSRPYSETTWLNWREDLIKFYNLDTTIPKDIVIIENQMFRHKNSSVKNKK